MLAEGPIGMLLHWYVQSLQTAQHIGDAASPSCQTSLLSSLETLSKIFDHRLRTPNVVGDSVCISSVDPQKVVIYFYKSQSPLGLYLLLLVPKTFSAHDPGKSNAQTFGITSRVCIVCSAYPSVWGCEAVLNSNLVSNPACNFFQNIEVNLTSRSNTIETDTLCNCTISFKYNFAKFFTRFVVSIGKK